MLVTGASGFIGSSLIEALAQTDCEIIALSRQGITQARQTKARLKIVKGRYYEDNALEEAFEGQVDIVFHLGSQTSAEVARSAPLEDLQQNVVGSLQLFEKIHQATNCPSVVFASTATIVGLTDCMPVDERVPADPLTLYDIDKETTEQHIKFYTREMIFKGVSLRLPNVYGPGPMGRSATDRSILNKIIKNAVEGKAITVYGEGRYFRDFMFIDDVVDAFLLAGRCDRILDGRHFVVGTGIGVTIRAAFELVAARVHHRVGKMVAVTSVEMPAGSSAIEMRNYVADARAFSELSGWVATYSLSDGIDRTIEALI